MTSTISLAEIAATVSCVFAVWMAVEMVFLLHYRRKAELRVAIDACTDIAVTRDLLAAIAADGADSPNTAFEQASTADRLRAARRLIQLVRGRDRERLFEICERASLFDNALNQLSSSVELRRIDSVRELALFGSAACIGGLRRCLANDASPFVRFQAAVALSDLGHLPPCRELLPMLNFGHWPLTKMHAGLFRSIATNECEAVINLSLDEAFRRERPVLVDALGWTGDFSVLPALERHANDSDPEVRCAALRSTRRVGHPAAALWVPALLLDPSDSVRIQAVRACGDLGLRETVPLLQSLVRNPSWWVRTRATEALDKLRVGRPGDMALVA